MSTATTLRTVSGGIESLEYKLYILRIDFAAAKNEQERMVILDSIIDIEIRRDALEKIKHRILLGGVL